MQPGESHSTLYILHLDISGRSFYFTLKSSCKREMCHYVDEDVSVSDDSSHHSLFVHLFLSMNNETFLTTH